MSSVYKAVICAELLDGSEMWELTSMEKTLQSFHCKCAWYVTRKHIQPGPDDFKGKNWYIKQRCCKFQNYTASRPIYERHLLSNPIVKNTRHLFDGALIYSMDIHFLDARRPVKLTTVPVYHHRSQLTNYGTMGQYNNLVWMPVRKKYTGCLVQIWVQQENKNSNTSTSHR
jgi:hypothetical protein